MWKGKRERSRNFLEEEKHQLLHIIKRFLPILENKKTDTASNNLKIQTWEFIADEFKSSAKTGYRTGGQLKALFDTLKKQARKHEVDDKAKLYKTIGGTHHLSQMTAIDAKVLQMIRSRVQPTDNQLNTSVDYDCDWSDNSLEVDNTPEAESSRSSIIAYEIDTNDEGKSTTPKSFEGHSEMSNGKRERSRNFLDEEKVQLLNIIKRFLPIVQNKKTDTASNNLKIQTWELIADEFNSSAKTGNRTGGQLKALFDTLKKLARKHEADDKAKIYKTIGSTHPSSQMTAIYAEVLQMIRSQVQPIDNQVNTNVDYDCDWSDNSVDEDNMPETENSRTTINAYEIDALDEGTNTTPKLSEGFCEMSNGKRERSGALFDTLEQQAKKHKQDDKTEEYRTVDSHISQSSVPDEEVLHLMGPRVQPIKNPLDCNEDYDFRCSDKSMEVETKPQAKNSKPTIISYAIDRLDKEANMDIIASDADRPPRLSKKRKEVNTNGHREEWHKKRMDILKIIEEREKIDLATATVKLKMIEEKEKIHLEKAKLELEITKIELEKIKKLNTP